MTTKQLEKITNTIRSKAHQKNQETGKQQTRASFILHTLWRENAFSSSPLFMREEEKASLLLSQPSRWGSNLKPFWRFFMTIEAIDLLGDSLLENHSYTKVGESVHDHMTRLTPIPVVQHAVDGDVIADTIRVLDIMGHDPKPNTGAVLSCSGNDALRASSILTEPVSSVFEAFSLMIPILDGVRDRYRTLLDTMLKIYDRELIRVMTIHNKIPVSPSMPREALTALGLFNELILEECFQRKLQIIDLRIISESPDSYSEISPIEPSGIGGLRISEAILNSYKKEV